VQIAIKADLNYTVPLYSATRCALAPDDASITGGPGIPRSLDKDFVTGPPPVFHAWIAAHVSINGTDCKTAGAVLGGQCG
jgi:hypothetical protein